MFKCEAKHEAIYKIKKVLVDKLESYDKIGKLRFQIVSILWVISLLVFLIACLLYKPGEGFITGVPYDLNQIQSIIEDVVDSEIEIISNGKAGQANLILESSNLDINRLYSYAGSIDPRIGSAHNVLIIRPKEDYYEQAYQNLLEYVHKKQDMLRMGKEFYDSIQNGIMSYPEELDVDKQMQLSDNAVNALVYKRDKYIILVMEDNPNSLLDVIVDEMVKQGLIEGNIKATEVDIDDIDDWIEIPLNTDVAVTIGS